MAIKFYELVADVETADNNHFKNPNTWKTRLTLLRKGISFEAIIINHLDVSTTLTERFRAQNNDPNFRATAPTIELEDGTLLNDSYQIALYLEETYPEAPSVFDFGSAKQVMERGSLAMGKRVAKLFNEGMGNSDPQWQVWYDIIVPQWFGAYPPGPLRDYVTQDWRHGDGNPGDFQKSVERPQKEDLVGRSKKAIGPLVTLLKEQGDFLQGQEPGFADFAVFGRYVMVRNTDTAIAKEIFEGVDPVIGAWVERMLEAFPEARAHLKPYST
ncbi:hypothetical protein HDU97_006447 [Phlyctochytrium planicorne]|nr:hypothetical protein HDU97_006447 [Phlyctochytrium planicorne]